MMMTKQTFLSFSLVLLFLLHCTNTLVAQPAAAPAQPAGPIAAPSPPSPSAPLVLPGPAAGPAPSGPTNVTKIFEKAGHFSLLIRLLKSTSVADQIEKQLNDTSNGVTIFAPADDAFSSLSSGTLNSLNDGEKESLMQFHVLSTYIPLSQFQTVSNPLRTNAGDSSKYAFPLNVTSYPNSVNISTGITNASLSGTVYTDGQLAIYQVNKVLLPWNLFGAKPPAPAPSPVKPGKQDSAAATVDDDGSDDDHKVNVSGAVSLVAMQHVVFFAAALCSKTLAQPAAAPAQPAGPISSPALPSPPTPLVLPGAAGPASSGPTNFTKILEKVGHFSFFIRLLKATTVRDQIERQLNDTNSGVTVFAPTDNAFSGLSSGTLNTLSDPQKELLIQFHVLSSYIPPTRFQTLRNPLRTNAGTNSRYEYPLNVTSSGNSVNISTGITNTSVSSIVYSDGQLAVYQVDKVLLPWSIFGAKPPAMAPAPAPLKPIKQNSTAVADGDDSTDDDDHNKLNASAAVSLMGMQHVVFLFGASMVLAIFSL
ncbi:hypothetical protein WN943_026332 [Citrus x changshan-huyou]